MNSILEYLPKNAEIGVGLALQNNQGNYIFFLPGTRHKEIQDDMFYAGIGGHLENGENLVECGQREAMEEIGTEVEIIAFPYDTYYIASNNKVRRIKVIDEPRPLAIYEMVHQKGTPREGRLYHIVIYQSRLMEKPKHLQKAEVNTLINMSREQVI